MRYLDIKIEEDVNYLFIKIVDQTHRFTEFSTEDNPRSFTASNGFRLASFMMPCLDLQGRTLFVRGTSRKHDDDLLLISKESIYLHYIPDMLEAVEKYNGCVLLKRISIRRELTVVDMVKKCLRR